MKPGDFIQWVSADTATPVWRGERVWCSESDVWVEVGHGALLISCTDTHVTVLIKSRVFNFRWDDHRTSSRSDEYAYAVPEVIKYTSLGVE